MHLKLNGSRRKTMRKIGLSELSRLGFEIRSSSYVYPKTGQIRKTYRIARPNQSNQLRDVTEYIVLAALPRGYELYYDARRGQPLLKKKLKKDSFPKLVEKRYPDKLVEVIDDA